MIKDNKVKEDKGKKDKCCGNIDLLVEASTRLNKIRELVIDGANASGSHHKQFYLSQIMKLVDKDLWLMLEDKGIPP